MVAEQFLRHLILWLKNFRPTFYETVNTNREVILMRETNIVSEKYFPVPENDPDYEPGKYDCIREIIDEKGRYWTCATVFKDSDADNSE
jgi:benzylsuccinate synthase/naphthyl-2-methylsuccinate synthase gamma subunit